MSKPRMLVVLVIVAALAAFGIAIAVGPDRSEDLKSDVLSAGLKSNGAVSCSDSKYDPTTLQGDLVGTDEESLPIEILKHLGVGAGDWVEGETLGWVFSLITGQHGSDDKQIEKQLGDVQTSINTLTGMVTDLQKSVNDSTALILKAITDESEKTQLSNQLTALSTAVTGIGTIRSHVTDLNHALQSQGIGHAKLTGQDESNVHEWRSEIVKDIDALVDGLEPAAPGLKSPIALYDDLVWKSLPSYVAPDPANPSKPVTDRNIMPAAYLNQAYDQVDYYTSALANAAEVMSSLYHLSLPDDDTEFDTNTVKRYTQCASDAADRWSELAGDGIGRVPADSIVDNRNHQTPRMWINTPVPLQGDPGFNHVVDPADNPSTAYPTPNYCPTPSKICVVNQYDANGKVASQALARPSAGALAQLLSDHGYGAFSDWRIPTSADWSALENSATGGLSAWGAAQDLTMLAQEKVPTYASSVASTVSVVPAALVNTGSADKPAYGVVTSADVTANTLRAYTPAGDTTTGYGGRLYLVRTLGATSEPITAPLASAAATASHRAKATLHAGDPANLANPTACSGNTYYTTPRGTYAVKIVATGGAGADGTENNSASAKGGVGAKVSVTIPIQDNTRLYYQIGGAGSATSGGVGGGGNGGATKLIDKMSNDHSGGGGGATGVSLTPGCNHWLALAGGGGGGGGGVSENCCQIHETGGNGGNAAITNANPTNGGDGADQPKEKQSGGRGAHGAQGGGPGSAGNTNITIGTKGGDGTAAAGGNGGDASTAAYPGGGGGGGGGGFYGGGAGGGGWQGAGGGGAGGGSFAIDGVRSNATFEAGAASQSGSLQIIPLTDTAVIQSAASNLVVNINGGGDADETTLIPFTRTGAANEQWHFAASDFGEGSLINPGTGKCAAVATTTPWCCGPAVTRTPARAGWPRRPPTARRRSSASPRAKR